MTKYVLANVQLPIRIDENGSIETLQPYAQIHVIKEIQSPEDVEPNSLVLKEEIHTGSRTSLKNTSFKNRKRYRHNATARKYT